jgi:hypothetical protein
MKAGSAQLVDDPHMTHVRAVPPRANIRGPAVLPIGSIRTCRAVGGTLTWLISGDLGRHDLLSDAHVFGHPARAGSGLGYMLRIRSGG